MNPATFLLLVHSWYPAICCNGNDMGGDCRPVPCDSIVETRDGVEWEGYKFTSAQTLPSQDRNCHVCVSTWHNMTTGKDSHTPHCAFIQPST